MFSAEEEVFGGGKFSRNHIGEFEKPILEAKVFVEVMHESACMSVGIDFFMMTVIPSSMQLSS